MHLLVSWRLLVESHHGGVMFFRHNTSNSLKMVMLNLQKK